MLRGAASALRPDAVYKKTTLPFCFKRQGGFFMYSSPRAGSQRVDILQFAGLLCLHHAEGMLS